MTYRLLKIVVQATLVEDDGENLSEQVAEPVVVKAADWPEFPARLAADLEKLNAEPVARDSEIQKDRP